MGPSIRSYLSHFRNVIFVVIVGLVIVFSILGVYIYGKNQRSADEAVAPTEQAQPEQSQDATQPTSEPSNSTSSQPEAGSDQDNNESSNAQSNTPPTQVSNTGPQSLSNTGPEDSAALIMLTLLGAGLLYRRSRRRLQQAQRHS